MNTWDHTLHVAIGVSAGEKVGTCSADFWMGIAVQSPCTLQINEEPSYSWDGRTMTNKSKSEYVEVRQFSLLVFGKRFECKWYIAKN